MLDYKRDIEPYLSLGADGKPRADLRHSFYQASIDHRDRLRQVFRKKMPDYLNINRPKERPAYKEYREKIYRNPMRTLRRRVIEVLDYIRQADDFDVSFKSETNTNAEDNFEQFVTASTYTKEGSAEEWFFKKVRTKYVDDPNAVLVVLPLQQPKSDQERVIPVPMLISCDKVYQHRKGEFAVLEATEKSWIQGPSGQVKKGKILLFVDHDSYCVAKQMATVKSGEDVNLIWDITGLNRNVVTDEQTQEQQVVTTFLPPLHFCPVMPARKIGKIREEQAEEKAKVSGYQIELVCSNDEGEEFYESILSDALPHVEGVQELGSDIQVERNFHVSSEEWRFGAKRCPDTHVTSGPCIDGFIDVRDSFTGKVIGKSKCPKCDGGYVTSGSGVGGLIIVSAPSATKFEEESRPTNLPIPPGGFIARNIEPLREFRSEYEKEEKLAYGTLSMRFLMESPNDQSGTAKRMDKEELYRTLIVEGAHLCGLFAFLLQCAAYQRRQEKETPSVLAPVRLSIENSEITRQELIEAIDKKFDTNLRAPLEKKLIKYQTGEDSIYYRKYELRERHDPYADLNLEDKLFLLSASRLTMEVGSPQMQELIDGIQLSIHFNRIVSDILRKSGNGFWGLEPDKQYEKLLEGAKAITGTIKPVTLDPKTGQPTASEGQLIPIVDLKNNSQLS